MTIRTMNRIRLKIKEIFDGAAFLNNRTSYDLFQYLIHIIISIFLGLIAGLGAIFFHYLLNLMRGIFEPSTFVDKFHISRYSIVIIPMIGALVLATMTRYFNALAREKGVISVIKSIILNNGYIPLKVTIFHLIAPIVCIGTGAPLGPEGPVAKLGSGIGSFVSRLLRLNKKDMVMYTAAGAAAAISAVFNAPIAGVFFGVEVVLMNDLKNRALSVLIISSVVADILSRAFLGNSRIISIPDYTIGPVSDYPIFFMLAILCGIVSIAYYILKKSIRYFIDEKIKINNEYAMLLPVAVFWGLILTSYFQLYGIGYGTINSVLNGGIPLTEVLLLFAFQIIFLALYLETGGYGGTYAPAISIGAFLGYSFAMTVNLFFHTTLDPTVFALVGMGGMLAGINSVPLTAIMLVFEVTQDYKFILPLMLVSILAYLATLYYNKGTVYMKELMDYGIDISKRSEIDILGKIKIKSIMRSDFDVVDHKMPFRMLLNIILNSNHGDLFVVDDQNNLLGVITLKNIRQAITDRELIDLLIARDLITTVPTINSNDPVSTAVHKIEEHESDCIPVVESLLSKKIIGIITMNDIIAAYNTQLEELETSQFLHNR